MSYPNNLSQSWPKPGMQLIDARNNGKQIFTVTEVFQGSSQYPGMILEWEQDGRKRGQAFTCKDWQERWEVIR